MKRLIPALICADVAFLLFAYLFPMELTPILNAAKSFMGGTVKSYPSMGYPLMFIPALWMGIDPYWWALVIQGVLCMWGVWLFFTGFKIEVSPFNVFLTLPFVAVVALMQTAAVPCFLVLLSVVHLRRERAWTAALLLTLAILFRTELAVLFLAYTLAYGARREVALFAIPFVLLVSLTGSAMSSNGPAVFFLSLGQLEGNPWGIEPTDAYVDSIAKERGVDAWDKDGAELFSRMSLNAVTSHLGWYHAKCAKNFVRAIISGPYIGEWRVTDLNWFKYPLHLFFACVMLWAFYNARGNPFLMWCVLGLLLGQALGQQMVRHWNVIYLPLLGVALEGGEN